MSTDKKEPLKYDVAGCWECPLNGGGDWNPKDCMVSVRGMGGDDYEYVPSPVCPLVLLTRRERECDGLREAVREFLLLFASGNSIPVDRVILKSDHRIVNMFRAAIKEGGGEVDHA